VRRLASRRLLTPETLRVRAKRETVCLQRATPEAPLHRIDLDPISLSTRADQRLVESPLDVINIEEGLQRKTHGNPSDHH
jgi:hypothetical protein